MLSVVAEGTAAPADPFALVLAAAALLVSLLAVVVPAMSGRQQRLRDDRAKRAEMYLELMELIELHGLWVVDRTYDLVETSDNDYVTEMPHRKTAKPERTLRVRARAIVSAYASVDVAKAFAGWLATLEAFEQQLDLFAFIAHEEGDQGVNALEAEPFRDAEAIARGLLADRVNAQLVRERRWRRWGVRP
ncbi:hypothetical protein PlfCFBP13513_14980 [Plantibacter flavus]|uniref:hypothetical protein n=1 Tax=Plantibacter TaxID=190323 RepID=UPI0010C1E7CD|nr:MULTISPECIES: hypothetical protein [Plantibacter]MBD8103798.1 hypothetical protein [Plantibacter sp. CFBP 8775]MBD8467247.1 hypothetical protein [Plantibacter sp. CFBP 8798]TKJ96726.1 hypothetical protein PlfCFBP13513_14980 [Plantibacter flavus]